MDSLNSNLFIAVVSSSDNGTYNVCVDPYNDKKPAIMQGIPLLHDFASTLGIKDCPVYPAGANVLCWHMGAERCYIIGIIPDADIAKSKFFSRACLQTADGNFDKQNSTGYAKEAVKVMTHNNQRPTDVTEGEFVKANEFGVLLGLFQTMANLKGSELAQIQCYLLDDLVRIISHNFQHWSALGELNIWHDGKAIMAEFGATHQSSESIGQPSVDSASSKKTFKKGKLPKPDDSEDFYEFETPADERMKAIERLKTFVGRLGDFIHVFLVRPDPEAVRVLSGSLSGKFDTGLFDIHVAIDGKVSVRSVAGIVLEKTNWIPVPHRVRTPEDPEGDDDISYPTKDPFEFDNAVKYQENPSLYFLQIRDCVAYLQDLYNYKNFLAHEKDFKLPTGPTDNGTALTDIQSVDPQTQVKLSDYVLRKSGVYLMENGGIAFLDAWGSAMVMEGGNIYQQPAKDLIQQPMRNHITKAGQFVSVAAKKDVDISSTEGGFRLKTEKMQHLYSKSQGMIIQTDADEIVAPRPEEEAYEDFGGIMLLAKESGIYSHSKKIYDDALEDSVYRSKKKMIIRSEEEDVYIIPEKNLFLLPTKDLMATIQGTINISTTGTAIFGGVGLTALGQKGKALGIVPAPSNKMGGAYDGVLEIGDLVATGQSLRDAIDGIIENVTRPFEEESKFEEVKFRFLSSDKYNLKENEDFIPMTIAQQNEQAFGFLDLKEWEEEEIEDTLPYPGKDKFASFYATSKLTNLQNLENSDTSSKDTASLTNKAESIQFESLQTYKILES
jgi:hypothetical protein